MDPLVHTIGDQEKVETMYFIQQTGYVESEDYLIGRFDAELYVKLADFGKKKGLIFHDKPSAHNSSTVLSRFGRATSFCFKTCKRTEI